MKIAIYFKKQNAENAKKVEQEALKHGFVIDNNNPDIVFSVGGDGTFLRAVHNYIDKLDKVLFIGINYGSLGFLYDFSKEEIPMIMEKISKNDFSVKEQRLLKGEVTYEYSKQDIFALNEIRIENPFHTLMSEVLINDELLETFCGNGLIVSSNLGSSAYNKSLGGALIDNDIEAMELTEVAGIQNKVYNSLNSSLIVNNNKTITFKGDIDKAIVGYDHLSLDNDDKLISVAVSCSDKKVRIIHDPKHSYIQRVKRGFDL